LYSSTGLQYIRRVSSAAVASSTDEWTQEFWWHILSTFPNGCNSYQNSCSVTGDECQNWHTYLIIISYTMLASK